MGCRGGFSRKMQKTGGGGAKIAPPLMKLGLRKPIQICCAFSKNINNFLMEKMKVWLQ